MTTLQRASLEQRDWLLQFVRELVRHESPSTDLAALENCAVWLAAELRDTTASVERVAAGANGCDHVIARLSGTGRPVAVLAHFDTVWPVGQIQRMPIHQADGKLFGPGVLDMKAGVGIAAAAIRALAEAHPASSRPPVTLLVTSDEEVGSATSRAAIEQLARECRAVLVVEPALPGGAVKTARKGVGEFHVIAHGISSHAGANPDAGASAVHELARQILALEKLADRARGISVNVGVVSGGTRSNVVAETATALVDLRVMQLDDARRISEAIANLRAQDNRVRIEIRGGINRPPMERTPGVAKLYGLARDVARELGRELVEGSTGGASDGNFTAALGVPTLDGLGAVGDGPHALHEHVIVDELPGRVALLAGLIDRIGEWDN